jgi:hypothetical protein
MLTVVYDPDNGTAVPDAAVASWVDDVLHMTVGSDLTVYVGSEAIVDEIRVRICRGEVSHTSIVFTYKDHMMLPDVNGRIQLWPTGFCDYSVDRLTALLR